MQQFSCQTFAPSEEDGVHIESTLFFDLDRPAPITREFAPGEIVMIFT